jgi:hypothetical protein
LRICVGARCPPPIFGQTSSSARTAGRATAGTAGFCGCGIRGGCGFRIRFDGANGLRCRLGLDHGRGRKLVSEGPDAVEVLDGAPVEALSLYLITEEKQEDIGLLEEAAEALGHGKGAILTPGDLDIVDHVAVRHDERAAIGVERLVQGGGKDAAFDAGAEEERLLGYGDTLESEEFLRVDGLVAGDEVGEKIVDGVGLLDSHDGEVASAEGVLAEDAEGV